MKTIVVGTDGSGPARAAVEAAAELATDQDATLHLVIAYRIPAVGAGVDMIPVMPSNAEIHASAATDIEAQAAPIRARGIKTEVHVCDGAPAQVLCDVATTVGADLIVVGNRHVQGKGRLLGSVATKVAHHAPCSVLIAKTS